jgi:hypothetical protein
MPCLGLMGASETTLLLGSLLTVLSDTQCIREFQCA